MISAELISLIKKEIKGLSSKFIDADYDNAMSAAEYDTGWSMPVSTSFKIKWMKQRVKRHLFSFRRDESADKFKYKQISLNQRFENFLKLIKDMDEDFEKALDEYAFEFADVDALHMMGTKVDAGFAYENQTGRDITMDENQEVIFTPDENA